MENLIDILESFLDKGNKSKTIDHVELMKNYIKDFMYGNGNFGAAHGLAKSKYKSLDPDIPVYFMKGGKGYIAYKDSILGKRLDFVMFERTSGSTVYRSRVTWYEHQTRNIMIDVCSNREAMGKIGEFHGTQQWSFDDMEELYEVPMEDMIAILKTVVDINGIPSYYNKPAIKYAERTFK